MTEQHKTVTLIHPDGREYDSAVPVEINDLVHGHGYRIKGGGSVDEAIASLGGNADTSGSDTAGTAEQPKAATKPAAKQS